MKPIMLNSNGYLMRKCEGYGQPLLCGPQYQVYNYYVDETAATNGDGTELNPWNNINHAFNANTYATCQFSCTLVYIHVAGEVLHGIGGSLSGEWGTKNYMSQLIFIPWQQARVAVNPGSNYIYVGGAQRTVYASGVVFRQFDFTQTLLPDTVASTALLICVAGTASYSPLTLNNCTITTYANTANLLPENTRVDVRATQSADLNNTIINVLAVGDAISDPARSGSFYGAYRGSCKNSTINLSISGRFYPVTCQGLTGDAYFCQISITVNVETANGASFGEIAGISWSSRGGTVSGCSIDINIINVTSARVFGVYNKDYILDSTINIIGHFSYTTLSTCVGIENAHTVSNSTISVMPYIVSYNPDPYGSIGYPPYHYILAVGIHGCYIVDTCTINTDWDYFSPSGERWAIRCPLLKLPNSGSLNIIDSELSDSECDSVMSMGDDNYSVYSCEAFADLCFGGE